jgi:hypothetical protein
MHPSPWVTMLDITLRPQPSTLSHDNEMRDTRVIKAETVHHGINQHSSYPPPQALAKESLWLHTITTARYRTTLIHPDRWVEMPSVGMEKSGMLAKSNKHDTGLHYH